MVNNFTQLANFISKNDSQLTPDNFYFCQIIRRSKDTPGKSSTTLKDFYIKNSQDLLDKADLIKE